MKATKLFVLAATMALMTTMANAQLNVAATGSIHAIGDFEFTYDAYGLSLEGALGQNFSVGMNADRGVYRNTSFLSFNPNVKLYSSKSFQGLYAGLGLRYFKVKSKDDTGLMYPLPASETNTTFFGTELKVGVSTIVEDAITMSLEVHAGKSLDLDEMYYGANFTVGVYLY